MIRYRPFLAATRWILSFGLRRPAAGSITRLCLMYLRNQVDADSLPGAAATAHLTRTEYAPAHASNA